MNEIEQTIQRLRAIRVIEPDHDSMTRFVPFVDVDASTWASLLAVVEIVERRRRRFSQHPEAGLHPRNAEEIELDEALARLGEASNTRNSPDGLA